MKNKQIFKQAYHNRGDPKGQYTYEKVLSSVELKNFKLKLQSDTIPYLTNEQKLKSFMLNVIINMEQQKFSMLASKMIHYLIIVFNLNISRHCDSAFPLLGIDFRKTSTVP